MRQRAVLKTGESENGAFDDATKKRRWILKKHVRPVSSPSDSPNPLAKNAHLCRNLSDFASSAPVQSPIATCRLTKSLAVYCRAGSYHTRTRAPAFLHGGGISQM